MGLTGRNGSYNEVFCQKRGSESKLFEMGKNGWKQVKMVKIVKWLDVFARIIESYVLHSTMHKSSMLGPNSNL